MLYTIIKKYGATMIFLLKTCKRFAIVLALIATQNAFSFLESMTVLQNTKSGKIMYILGDIHVPLTEKTDQTEVVFNLIEKLATKKTKTLFLLESQQQDFELLKGNIVTAKNNQDWMQHLISQVTTFAAEHNGTYKNIQFVPTDNRSPFLHSELVDILTISSNIKDEQASGQDAQKKLEPFAQKLLTNSWHETLIKVCTYFEKHNQTNPRITQIHCIKNLLELFKTSSHWSTDSHEKLAQNIYQWIFTHSPHITPSILWRDQVNTFLHIGYKLFEQNVLEMIKENGKSYDTIVIHCGQTHAYFFKEFFQKSDYKIISSCGMTQLRSWYSNVVDFKQPEYTPFQALPTTTIEKFTQQFVEKNS